MKEKNNNQNQSTQIIATVLAIAILIVAVVGISFAVFTYSGTGEKVNTIETGTITLVYSEGTNGITITNAMPVSDDVGKAITPGVASTGGTSGAWGEVAEGASGVFDFNVAATISGTATIKYDVVAKKNTNSSLANTEVKLYLQKSTSSTYASTTDAMAPANFKDTDNATKGSTTTGKALGANNMVLATGTFSASGTDYYRLKMWVDQSYRVTETAKTFTVTIDVYGE